LNSRKGKHLIDWDYKEIIEEKRGVLACKARVPDLWIIPDFLKGLNLSLVV